MLDTTCILMLLSASDCKNLCSVSLFLLADAGINTNCFKMRHISNGNIDTLFFLEFNVNAVDDSRLPLKEEA